MTSRGNGQNAAPAGHDSPKTDRPSFSWLQPHPIFVVILVGSEETPFGLQKDLLCAASVYFRRHFKGIEEDTVEHVVRIPDTTGRVFGLAQNFMYTREVWPDDGTAPSYEDLFALWQLSQAYELVGLCDKTLECMEELKQRTRHIPGPTLISRVWKETEEGCPIRRLFLQWADEYFQSSDAPTDFAKSLPREFLCELVIEMSAVALPITGDAGGDGRNVAGGAGISTPLGNVRSALSAVVGSAKRHANQGEEEGGSDDDGSRSKKSRRVSGPSTIPLPPPTRNGAALGASSISRRSLPGPTKNAVVNRRINSIMVADGSFTDAQKVDFCADLLSRMLSGPGYWTRLVKPFRQPVDPAVDGVPDYFEKIEKPMDLMTIKSKMEKQMYSTAGEFAGDVRLIVENCKAYWKEGHPLYGEAEKFGKSFEEKFAEMSKWLSKMHSAEQGSAV